jgi:hypothetical protein
MPHEWVEKPSVRFIPPQGAMQFEITHFIDGRPCEHPYSLWVEAGKCSVRPDRPCSCTEGWRVILESLTPRNQDRCIAVMRQKRCTSVSVCVHQGRIIE